MIKNHNLFKRGNKDINMLPLNLKYSDAEYPCFLSPVSLDEFQELKKKKALEIPETHQPDEDKFSIVYNEKRNALGVTRTKKGLSEELILYESDIPDKDRGKLITILSGLNRMLCDMKVQKETWMH